MPSSNETPKIAQTKTSMSIVDLSLPLIKSAPGTHRPESPIYHKSRPIVLPSIHEHKPKASNISTTGKPKLSSTAKPKLSSTAKPKFSSTRKPTFSAILNKSQLDETDRQSDRSSVTLTNFSVKNVLQPSLALSKESKWHEKGTPSTEKNRTNQTGGSVLSKTRELAFRFSLCRQGSRQNTQKWACMTSPQDLANQSKSSSAHRLKGAVLWADPEDIVRQPARLASFHMRNVTDAKRVFVEQQQRQFLARLPTDTKGVIRAEVCSKFIPSLDSVKKRSILPPVDLKTLQRTLSKSKRTIIDDEEWSKLHNKMKAARASLGHCRLAQELEKLKSARGSFGLSAPPQDSDGLKSSRTSLAQAHMAAEEIKNMSCAPTTGSNSRRLSHASSVEKLTTPGSGKKQATVSKGGKSISTRASSTTTQSNTDLISSCKPHSTKAPEHKEYLSVVKRIMQRKQKEENQERWIWAIRMTRHCVRVWHKMAERSYESEVHHKTFLDIGWDFGSQTSSQSRLKFLQAEERGVCQSTLSRESKRILLTSPELRTPLEIKKALSDLQFLSSFCSFPLSTQKVLAAQGTYQFVTAKRVVIRKGHLANNYYFILYGLAQATKTISLGSGETRRTETLLTQGQSFGQEAILGGHPHEYSVLSHQSLHLLSIPAQHFYQVVKDDVERSVPKHILFLSQQDWMKHWPICELLRHPTQSYMYYARNRQVIVADSLKDDKLYVVRSGECIVMMKILSTPCTWKDAIFESENEYETIPSSGTTSLDLNDLKDYKEASSWGCIFPSRKAFYKESPHKGIWWKTQKRRGVSIEEGLLKQEGASTSSILTKGEGTRHIGKVAAPPSTFPRKGLQTSANPVTSCDRRDTGDGDTDNYLTPYSLLPSANMASSILRYGKSRKLPSFVSFHDDTSSTESQHSSRQFHHHHRQSQRLQCQRRRFIFSNIKSPKKSGFSAWVRRKAYRIPQRCLPPPPARPRPKVNGDAGGQPIYYCVRTLTPGSVFGFDQMVLPLFEEIQPKPEKISLVSCGAEIIVMEKRFFIQHANSATQQLVFSHNLANTLPTSAQLKKKYMHDTAWQLYLKKASDEVLQDIGRRRKYYNMCFQPSPILDPRLLFPGLMGTSKDTDTE